MKAAPEKIYLEWYCFGDKKYREWVITPKTNNEPVEYTRTNIFIENTLKWYCLDCECNDNCKDTKCFFYNEYKRFLEGEKKAIPPKFSGRILNEDGSTSDNWRYRHFIAKMQEAFIEKACEFISLNVADYIDVTHKGGIEHLALQERFIDVFRNYMKGE